MSLKSHQVKSIALKAGFHKSGITPANQPAKSTLLEEWLKNGNHGTMSWMASYKIQRMNIKKLMPEARSVVVVAHNYFTPVIRDDESDYAKISRYAWGKDYHKIMKKKLKKMLSELKILDPDLEGRICVDTAPIMEKLWAEQAGIGWQGKHTNIITREYGSWIFLGEILINKEVEYDSPATDMCGSCTRCISACPTDAIHAPYQLDANKCISYLTIEYWGKPIPDQFIEKFSGYVFGCDICQDVCPWNKYQKETDESEYSPLEENINPRFEILQDLTESQFKTRFKKSRAR